MPWAERAETELRATGETARKRDVSAAGQLTPQELQIAGLVAEGLRITNGLPLPATGRAPRSRPLRFRR